LKAGGGAPTKGRKGKTKRRKSVETSCKMRYFKQVKKALALWRKSVEKVNAKGGVPIILENGAIR